MVSETLHSHGLPNDVASRVGRLIEARGQVVEASFDPDALPDLLAELMLSDETNGRPVTVQVVQRPGGGIVRGVTIAPVDGMPRGASLLNSLRHAEAPIDQEAFERAVTLLAGPSPAAGEIGRLLETGIKVVDVMCPLIAGGTLAIAGEYGAGDGGHGGIGAAPQQRRRPRLAVRADAEMGWGGPARLLARAQPHCEARPENVV